MIKELEQQRISSDSMPYVASRINTAGLAYADNYKTLYRNTHSGQRSGSPTARKVPAENIIGLFRDSYDKWVASMQSAVAAIH